jgi:hypothetical protein
MDARDGVIAPGATCRLAQQCVLRCANVLASKKGQEKVAVVILSGEGLGEKNDRGWWGGGRASLQRKG